MTKGFTLLEILVTILIFTFIIGGMYGVLNIAKTNYDTNLVALNLQRQVRQGMSWLSREVRQAYWDSTVLGSPVTSIDPVSLVTEVTYHSITFDTPDATGVEYSLVSGKLKRKSSIDTTGKTIANDITGLSFSAIAGNMQKITLEASKTFSSGGQERTLTFSLTEQVQVRN